VISLDGQHPQHAGNYDDTCKWMMPQDQSSPQLTESHYDVTMPEIVCCLFQYNTVLVIAWYGSRR